MENESKSLRISKLLMARGLTREAAAKKLGTSPTALSAVINEKRPLSKGLEAKIILAFGVNKDWLANGVGDMFSNGIDLSLKIPFFDLEKFECGKASGFAGALIKSKADCYITLPGVTEVHDMFAVRAHGVSMINRRYGTSASRRTLRTR
jgi:transcriptional regulator with XRE-family HTH domain